MPSFEKKVGTARASGQKITFVRTKYHYKFLIKVGKPNKKWAKFVRTFIIFVRTFIIFVRTF